MEEKNYISESAARLKKIRLYLGMTRDEFGNAIRISQFTIRSWENGKKSFTADGVNRVISALKNNINFICSFDWLMHGLGPSPISLSEDNHYKPSDHIELEASEANMLREVLNFKKQNASVNVVVAGDKFKPLATKGDYVGLLPVKHSKLDQVIDCIVFVMDKKQQSYLGTLLKKDGDYFIHCLNASKPTKVNIQTLSKIEKIVWLRKNF